MLNDDGTSDVLFGIFIMPVERALNDESEEKFHKSYKVGRKDEIRGVRK